MWENRLSGSEGGVALTRHPYPYRRYAMRGLRVRAATATDYTRRADGHCSTAIHEDRAPISPRPG